MAEQSFLSDRELKRLTGETSPDAQIAILECYGLKPFKNAMTGKPVIYRAVVMRAMLMDDSTPREGSNEINWSAIDDIGKKKTSKVLRKTTQRQH